MKKLLKICLPLILTMVVFVVVLQFFGLGLGSGPFVPILLFVLMTVVLIRTLIKIGKGQKKSKKSAPKNTAAQSGTTSVPENADWYDLSNIADSYSGWQDLGYYAKVEFSVRYESHTFTIDYSLDLDACDEDANVNDIKASLRNAINRLAKNIQQDAARVSNYRISVQVPTVY
ncbi:MAG: hypothetical protein IJW50_10715 [Clostridia bacterium]|nr:hypothetical protein [Clostridia bacterium]